MSKNEQIDKVADLACLKLDASQTKDFQGHFHKILQYFKSLEKVDTEDVEPMITPHGIRTALRQDIVNRDITTEELLENAPEVKDSLFKVPPVV